jgi:hypothetical protein
MITASVIHRVFRIRVGAAEGTAFAVDVDQRQYLVTARHIAAGIVDGNRVDLFSNGGWIQSEVRLVGHGAGEEDVTVVSMDRQLAPPSLRLPPTSTGLIYGQDAYFLGFPYGYVGKYLLGPDGFPLPFVKKAVVSLFDGARYLLDGHNNPGFSGGPLVFHQPPNMEFRIAAVISGFQATAEPVFAGDQKTPLSYHYNTGIIVAYQIEAALRLISEKPIGFPTVGAA